MINLELLCRRVYSPMLLILVVWLPTMSSAQDKGPVSVICTSEQMVISVPAEGVSQVVLDKWAGMPGCDFTHDHLRHSISLALSEDLPCGTVRVRNTVTDQSVFYQRIIITNTITATGATADGEYLEEELQLQEKLLVKCSAPLDSVSSSHNIVKRELPPGFREPDYIEITSEVTGTAPVPILGVGVRQDGSLVEGAVNVQPGTPLTMEVYLDERSSDTYGILVSFLEVTDNGNKEETIVYNGCTIDPNLFENFVTKSGDFLAAKFRAFKFPESNYVLFRGTVDVCLDKCQGITCSDGKIGYGRRRRSVDPNSNDPNKLFEVTMTTYIKFAEDANKSPMMDRVDVSEIVTEERLRERLSYSGLSPQQDWSEAVQQQTLTRRSPDSPPSISFNAAGAKVTIISCGQHLMMFAACLGMFLIGRVLS